MISDTDKSAQEKNLRLHHDASRQILTHDRAASHLEIQSKRAEKQFVILREYVIITDLSMRGHRR